METSFDSGGISKQTLREVLEYISTNSAKPEGVTRESISNFLTEKGVAVNQYRLRSLISGLKAVGFVQSNKFFYTLTQLGVNHIEREKHRG